MKIIKEGFFAIAIPILVLYLFFAWVAGMTSLSLDYLSFFNWNELARALFGFISGIWAVVVSAETVKAGKNE